MATNIVVPALGESVTEATVAKWTKAVGDTVQRDEPLLELETDKVTLEVYASTNGRLGEIRAPAGATVEVGAVLGVIAEGADGVAAAPAAAAPAASTAPAPAASEPAAPAPAAPAAPAAPVVPAAPASSELQAPSVRKIVAESGIDITGAQGSGKDGRLIKADAAALAEIARETRKAAAAPSG
jgi:2-oxoglutarate dehydrogenase E2 component (dihydrolipoamide succinyltransferase)